MSRCNQKLLYIDNFIVSSFVNAFEMNSIHFFCGILGTLLKSMPPSPASNRIYYDMRRKLLIHCYCFLNSDNIFFLSGSLGDHKTDAMNWNKNLTFGGKSPQNRNLDWVEKGLPPIGTPIEIFPNAWFKKIRIHLLVKYCGSRKTPHSCAGEILGVTNYRSIVGSKRDLIGPKDGPGAHFAA